jgi:hypothetical protein
MEQFMESVYMQQTMPSNTTGVPITLSVLDANGNFRTIGTTTSDASGTFAYNWIPDISGAYTLYATFGGSESYYGSAANAHFFASEQAATPTEQPNQTSSSMVDTYFLPSVAAIIVVIIIVGAVLWLALRKKP